MLVNDLEEVDSVDRRAEHDRFGLVSQPSKSGLLGHASITLRRRSAPFAGCTDR